MTAIAPHGPSSTTAKAAPTRCPVVPPMMGLHSVIGVGEAIITTGVIAFLIKVAPEAMSMGRESEPKGECDAA